jgi:hypothetical protein
MDKDWLRTMAGCIDLESMPSPRFSKAICHLTMPDLSPKRCVYHLGGFDPMTPEASHRRFEREIARFEPTWSVEARVGPVRISDDEALWTTTASGPGWQVDSEHHLLRWDDVIEAARARPQWRRVPEGFLALFDFIRHGALWGYLRRSHRYAGFFLYPLLLLLGMAALSVYGGVLVARLTGFSLVGLVAAPLAFSALIMTLGQRLFLDHLLDDWIFAQAIVYRDDPVLAQRLARIADSIAARQAADPDIEILIVGHSLGAVLAVDLVERILAREQGNGLVRLMTIGSSILKIGFHRRALRLRERLKYIGASDRVFWVEYQALNDVMNFYKREPLAELKLPGHGALIRTVRFSRMLDPEAYARIKRNLFRLHCQFISGNTKRDAFDYYMLLCGPFTLENQARSPDGAVTWISADGRISPDAPIDRLRQGTAP